MGQGMEKQGEGGVDTGGEGDQQHHLTQKDQKTLHSRSGRHTIVFRKGMAEVEKKEALVKKRNEKKGGNICNTMGLGGFQTEDS